MPAQVPTIAEIVVLLDQLNAIALRQAQLIIAPRNKVMDDDKKRPGSHILLAGGSGSHIPISKCSGRKCSLVAQVAVPARVAPHAFIALVLRSHSNSAMV
jgi:hypothetical protein